MDWDDLKPKPPKGITLGESLESLSVSELEARIAALHQEIERVQGELAAKRRTRQRLPQSSSDECWGQLPMRASACTLIGRKAFRHSCGWTLRLKAPSSGPFGPPSPQGEKGPTRARAHHRPCAAPPLPIGERT